MKRKFLLIALGAALAGTAWAQSTDSTNTPPPNPPPPGNPPPGEHHGDFFSKVLTPEEEQEFKAAHDAAIKANPDLGTEEKELMDKIMAARASGQPPDPQLKVQADDFHKKMHDAMLKADPNLGPILAKLNAARKMHHGGPPPPPPPPANSAPAGN